MDIIAFYVSNMGYGHMTRTLAIVKNILENTNYSIYYVCGDEQIDYATVFLSRFLDRVHFNKVETDANVEYIEGTLAINKDITSNNIINYLVQLESIVKNEVSYLKDKDVKLIITDITIIGIKVGEKLGVKTIGITNYTLFNRYLNSGIDEKIIEEYKDEYNKLSCLYRYEFSDNMDGIDCPKDEVGLICRDINELSRGDLKSKYWPSVYISCGQLTNKGNISVHFPSGNIFVTGNIKIDGEVHVVKLPKRVAHSQDFVAASSFAIIKPSWSLVAECLINNVPFGAIKSEDGEDNELLNKLVEKNYCFVMEENELNNIDIRKYNQKISNLHKGYKTNCVDEITSKILNIINNKLILEV